jgi:membrane protein DedA with SNARE-associated domain
MSLLFRSVKDTREGLCLLVRGGPRVRDDDGHAAPGYEPGMTSDPLGALGATLLLDIGRYGYAALAAGVLLENAGVPVPGETMLLAAAALAARGRLSIVVVALVAATAAILGDNIGFAIGRAGGRPALERFGKWVFVTPERLDAVDHFFERRGPLAVVGARFVPALRVVGALGAGASRMRWPVFVLFNAIGAVAWATVVSAVGYGGSGALAGALPWLRAAHASTWGLLVLTAAALAVHAVYVIIHERRLRSLGPGREER